MSHDTTQDGGAVYVAAEIGVHITWCMTAAYELKRDLARCRRPSKSILCRLHVF